MVLRLDPRLPVVWRDPHTMQVGLEPPVAVLADLAPAEERMLAALAVGVTEHALRVLAGGDGAGVSALLQRVRPALEPAPRETPGTALVLGDGETPALLGARLADTGILPPRDDDEPDLVVLTGHFVLRPDEHGSWLRRDIPHLPVLFGDTAVEIGPLVEPGRTACLHCVALHRRDDDEAWPQLAAQLLGRRGGAETALTVLEAVSEAARRVQRRLGHGPDDEARSVRIAALDGARTGRLWPRHAECGCHGVADELSARRRGSDSPAALHLVR